MDYENFLGMYPSYDDEIFQQKIYNKKEFFDYKLSTKVEEIKPGEPLYSQRVISRFVNEHTLYDELLLYHYVGTGKTGVAFGITEKLKESKKFFRAYIFARGEDLLRQQKRQLVYMYSPRYKNLIKEQQFKPENEEKVLNKITSDFYSFRTVETFAKELSLAPDEYIVKEYSNCIFVIDEVHNLVEQGDEQATFYKQFFRLFHLVKNRKILLMSGTPMRNEVHEIADVMNLLLPESEQMPTKEKFTEKFTVGDTIISESKLKEFFRGRISYLRESVENIPTKFMGRYTTTPEVEQFKVFTTDMSEFQSEAYLKYYAEDTSGGQKMSFYANSRQASLFVFPDKTIGNEGLMSHTNKQGNLTREFIPRVNTLQSLSRYSSKYSFIIQDILANPKKKVYIYCSVVNGSGCNLLAKILELYGFEKMRSGITPTKGKRYILLTSETQNIQKLLTAYNSKRNKFGDYCQVIIGSRKISEGFNFKDIQIIHITTLHWNYTETQQAIARGIRLRSHINLIEEGIVPLVKIYQHAAIPSPKGKNSIDLHMLDISQKKDILMKKLERVVQESAMDCPLFYERNKRDTGNGTRECNYQTCDYKCDTSGLLPSVELDLSTYNLYYQTGENILNFLKNFFKTNFYVHLDTAQDALRIDRFQLIKTLDGLIQNNIPIVNKYQVECFLRESSGVYFLVDNIAIPNQQSEVGLYTSQPFFVEKKSLNKIIREKSLSVAVEIIRGLSQSKSKNQVQQLLSRLTVEYQEILLERALYYSLVDKRKTPLIEWILDIYQPYWEKSKSCQAISKLLEPKYRCLDSNNEWIDALKPDKLDRPEDMEIFEQNPWGYIGIVDKDNFCIRDLRNPPGKTQDKREKKTGAKCLEAGWNKDKLARLCIDLQIPIPDVHRVPADPRSIIMTKPSLTRLLDTTWSDLTDDDLGKVLYWYEQTKQNTCRLIKEWFSEHGLLIKGPCGKTGKLKN